MEKKHTKIYTSVLSLKASNFIILTIAGFINAFGVTVFSTGVLATLVVPTLVFGFTP